MLVHLSIGTSLCEVDNDKGNFIYGVTELFDVR